MIYEVVNMHDPVTIETDNEMVAMLAVLSLGEGAYGLQDETGRSVVPVLLFASPQQTKDWLDSTGINIGQMGNQYAAEIAECLRTALVCKPGERAKIMAKLGEDSGDIRTAMATWNDKKRSSMTDLCGFALSLAQAYEDHAAKNAAADNKREGSDDV